MKEEILFLRKELDKEGQESNLLNTTQEEIILLEEKLREKEEEFRQLINDLNKMYDKREDIFEKHIKTEFYVILNEIGKINVLEKSKEKIKNKVDKLCYIRSGLIIA